MSALSVMAILQGMADALPTHKKGDETSDLASSYEAIALLVHSYMAALSFKLIGLHEDKTHPDAESLAPRLPPQWNDGYGSIRFVYSHKQSSMKFVVSIDKIGTKVEIRGLALGDEKIYRYETKIGDVTQSKSLPLRITMTEEGEEDRSDLVEKLSWIFISDETVSSLLRDVKINIIQKLIPYLQSENYVEEAEAQANADAERRANQYPPYRFPGPNPRPNVPAPQPYPTPGLLPDLARPRPPPTGDIPMPGFEDEHRMQAPPPMGFPTGYMPGTSPYGIGHDDLNPPGLGPHDPLRPAMNPGGLRMPGHSGMHPSFDDPLFSGQGGGPQFPQGPQGSGYDPQVPPGARYDPTGPGGGPRFPGPGQGRGSGGGYGGSGGYGGFSGGGFI